MKFKDKMVKEAMFLQIRGVKPINEKESHLGFLFEVGDHIVRIYKKKGRCIIDCDCKNCTFFCNTNGTLCKYKLAGIMEYIRVFR